MLEGLSSPSTPPGKFNKPVYDRYPIPHALAAELADPLVVEPSSYTQANKYAHWGVPIQEEHDALLRNMT